MIVVVVVVKRLKELRLGSRREINEVVVKNGDEKQGQDQEQEFGLREQYFGLKKQIGSADSQFGKGHLF
jgi:hypothetical protein